MNSKILIVVLVVVLIGVVGFMVTQKEPSEVSIEKNGTLATIYKSPACGCCGVYASYMKREGYSVAINDIQNMSSIKEQFNVPYELESCHTMEIGGYIVEGHIPQEAIEKLLTEKPNIKGIGMPGMPSGSPGMPGPKTADFVIYTITHEGDKGNIFMTI